MEKIKWKFLVVVLIVCEIEIVVGQGVTSCYQCGLKENEINCGYETTVVGACTDRTKGCFVQLYKDNTSDISGYFTRRGCAEKLTDSCELPLCKKCSNIPNCNTDILPLDRKRLSCIKCSDNDCADPTKYVKQQCGVYEDTSNSCVTLFDDDAQVLKKGCYMDIPDDTKDLCDDEGFIDCSKCEGENCNTDIERRGRKCFRCSGISCFAPNAPADIDDCLSECFVGINAKGENVRGCLSDPISTTVCGPNNQNCYVCDNDLCNIVEYPTENRLQCFTCSGETCDGISESKPCEIYGSTEKCITLFDGDKVSARGCSSTFTTQCTGNDNCRSCDQTNCNSHESKDKINPCIICDTKNDQNCVISPSQIGYCTSNKCYSRLLVLETDAGGQHIERGCREDLTECVDSDCSECTGSLCNNRNFPADRKSCIKCENENCQSEGSKTELCHLYSENSQCISLFTDLTVVSQRACYTDVVKETRESCDEKNQINCVKCGTNNCNSVQVRPGNICIKCSGASCIEADTNTYSVACDSDCYVGRDAMGFIQKGCASEYTGTSNCATSDDQQRNCLVCQGDFCNAIVYPLVNRLKCVICVGDDCTESPGNLKSEHCSRLHSEERCVTLFDSNSNIIERGCLSNLQNEVECNGNPTNCIKCNSENCNVIASVSQKGLCVSCDSRSDSACVANPQISTKIGCTLNQCYNKLNGKFIQRGCFTSNEALNCTTSTCQRCSGQNCNSKIFPADRLTCHYCRNEECNQQIIPVKYCEAYSTNKTCMTYYKDKTNVAYKDCYLDAPNATITTCNDPSHIDCTICHAKNCNSDRTRRGSKCFSCNGVGCYEANFPADVVDCTSDCYVGINERGETVRGCSNKFPLTNCAQNAEENNGLYNCTTCTGDLCNVIKFPMSQRLQCYTCLDDDCKQPPSNEQSCPLYGSNDACVTVFDNTGNPIERGCLSALKNSMQCDGTNCINCYKDKCNTDPTNKYRQCAFCDSSKESDCVLDPKLVGFKKCTKGCFTQIKDGKTIRGCEEDLTEECSGPLCKVCASNNCNIETFPASRLSCHNCENDNCLGAVQVPTQLCLNYKADDKCVVIFDRYQVKRRGCLSDIPTPDSYKCYSDSAECISCSIKNCNTAKIRLDDNCLICNSRTDPVCAQSPETLMPKQCSVAGSGQCYSLIDGQDTIRGCLGSLTSDQLQKCTLNSQCNICGTEGCNKGILPRDRLRCYYCDSQSDQNCAKEQTDESKIRYCKNFDASDKCKKVTIGTRVVRSCLSDSDVSCSGNQCAQCNRTACNYNSGATMKFNFVILILSVLIGVSSVFV